MQNLFFKSFVLILILILIQMPIHAQHEWTRTNPGGGGAIATIGATADGMLVAGSDLSGVYIKKNNSDTWQPIGATQGLNQTSITSFGFHPTNGTTFIIGTGIGAFKTIDGGETVYQVQIETDPNLGVGYVESIGMAINNDAIGYMAHYEYWLPALSFLRTNDAGETWSLVTTQGIPTEARITKLIVDPNNEDLVYALAGKARFGCSLPNLYKSLNGGQNWEEIGGEFQAILDIDLHPTDANIIYITTFEAGDCAAEMWKYAIGDDTTGAFYKSVDGGASFNEISEHTGIISVGVDPNEISLVNTLTLRLDNSNAGTWSTIDGGTNWNHTGHIQDWDIGWANPNYAYGQSFNGLSKSLTKNRFNPKNLNGCFGQWGWSSTDGGNTINNITSIEVTPNHFISTGLENIAGNALAINDANPNIVYAGYYDIGFWYSKNHGASWQWSIPDIATYPEYSWWNGGGTNTNLILSDPQAENVVWATFSEDQPETKSGLFKSTDYGAHWTLSSGGLDPLGLTTYGLSIDKKSSVDNRTLFITQNGTVFKSTDGGANWNSILTDGGLKFTEVDNFNSNLVYAGGENGLWRSDDGGATWSEKGLPEMRFSTNIANAVMTKDIAPTFGDDTTTPQIVPWQGVFEIKADPNIGNRVYVVAYGTGKGLYRSNDAGETWQKLYTNDKMRGVAIAPDNSDVVYASSSLSYHSGGFDETSIGILVTYNADADQPTWAFANEGMAWSNGGRLEIEKGATPNIWAWSPGTGVQYALVPNFEAKEEEPIILENGVVIYPNPVGEQLTIDYTSITASSKIYIYAMDGKLVVSSDIEGGNINQLDVSMLSSGLYVVHIDESERFKILKK